MIAWLGMKGKDLDIGFVCLVEKRFVKKDVNFQVNIGVFYLKKL